MKSLWKVRRMRMLAVVAALCGASAWLLGCCCCCCGWRGVVPAPQHETLGHSRNQGWYNLTRHDHDLGVPLHNHSQPHANHRRRDDGSGRKHTHPRQVQTNGDTGREHHDVRTTSVDVTKMDDFHNKTSDANRLEFYDENKEIYRNSRKFRDDKDEQEFNKDTQIYHNSQEDNENAHVSPRGVTTYTHNGRTVGKYVQKDLENVYNETHYVQAGPTQVQGDIGQVDYVQKDTGHVHNDTQGTQYAQDLGVEPAQDGGEEVSERSPRVILLLSTWRSGSTFLGELLATADPDTFYSYEPLHQWKITMLHHDNSATRTALAFLKDLFRCRLDRHPHQVSYLVRQQWYLRWNTRLATRCYQDQGNTTSSCSNATVVSQVCRNSSLHVAKVLRLGLRWVLPLLEDDDLDLQVVYLVRDPRAVLRSRVRLPWCKASPACRDPGLVCSHLHQDLLLLPHFLRNYPHKFRMVLYEALLENFEASVRQLFAVLRLPLPPRHLLFLRAKGGQPSGLRSNEEPSHARGTYGTTRILKYQARVWRFKTTFRDMVADQRHCLPVLRLLGLRVFNSAMQFNNHRIPILLARPQPRPLA